MSKVLLEIQDLHKRYGNVEVLKGVDCTMQEGEVISIIGSSGSGKTTMLRCINMLEEFQGGRILLEGEEIGYEQSGGTRKRKSEKDIARQRALTGMAFQQFNLFPHMTAAHNIMLGLLKVKKMPRDEARAIAEKWLDRVGLASRADHYPGQLSGGQQQRVAIARAIVVEPPLVLMDEPLSNLDAKLRLEMRAEIRRIHNTLGATTIYVTHDQEEALSLADRIVVLRDGQVRQVGTPEDLFMRPDHLDVAEFMGFRNKVKSKVVSAAEGRATLASGAAQLSGRTRNAVSVGADGYLAIRPEDLHPVASSQPGLKAQVVSTEFRGREFVGFARMADGTDLSFLAHDKLSPGEAVTLAADPDRVLVYGGAA